MSMIFQSYAIWPNMTVFENVAFGLQLRKLAREEIRSQVGEILEIVRLGDLAGRYPSELSGGQQQRVALARAVVIRPAVLLLDEPLSNLDANLREEMRFEIRRMHDELRITTVYVTHDQAEAMVTSDRIAVMSQGRIEQVDRPVDLYMRPRTRFVASFIGRTNFLQARRESDRLVFDDFSVPLAAVPGSLPNGASVTVSVRPHALGLSAARPEGAPVVLEGRIARRAFLGESWTYMFAPAGGGSALTVTAAPDKVLEDNAPAWLTIDPTQLVPIA
jgi:iron(III) transport system ATP-binding protein